MKTKASANVHLGVTLIWNLLASYMIFFYAPNDVNQGQVYRIIYIQVPSAWTAMLAYFLVFLGSLRYLWTRSPADDEFAHASAEVGFIFCTCAIVTGPLWAKPVLRIWWDRGDWRLLLTFILWLLYVSYLMLRSYVSPNRSALLAAVVGIIGFVDTPIDYMAIRWWHPQPVIMGGADSGLAPHRFYTLLVSWGAFLCVFTVLLRERIWLAQTRRAISLLRRDLIAREA